MKFDRKYATIKEPKRSDLIVEETDESEPIINYEKSTPSPRDSHHGQSRLRRQAEQVIDINFVFSKKAIKIDEIFTADLTLTT